MYIGSMCIGSVCIAWFRVQFGKNMHKLVFQRPSKLHESEGRLQLEVFEKHTSVCFFKLHETILLLINNIHEKINASHFFLQKNAGHFCHS
jgi:hypothetical protein